MQGVLVLHFLASCTLGKNSIINNKQSVSLLFTPKTYNLVLCNMD